MSAVSNGLVELGVSLAMGTTTSYFTPTPSHTVVLFVAIGVQTVANAFFRAQGNIYYCMVSFAYITAYNIQNLIHEWGHAVAANQIYQNANPRISLIPFFWGKTQYNSEHYTEFGEGLGPIHSRSLIALAGPVFSLLASGAGILIANALRPRFAELAMYFMLVSEGDFYCNAVLAAIAPFYESPDNDFAPLKAYGSLVPLVASVSFISIPTLLSS